jgi:hypothetical protein
MQNSMDRQRLLRRFGQEPAHPALVIAICLIGFLILLGILLIGVYAPEDSVGTQVQSVQARATEDKSADAAASQQPPASAPNPKN